MMWPQVVKMGDLYSKTVSSLNFDKATSPRVIKNEDPASATDSILSVNSISDPTSVDCSSLSSYTSLAGFESQEGCYQGGSGNPKADVNPQLLQKLELQGKINEIVHHILTNNSQLFIRHCFLSEDDQIKVFGESVLQVSEILSTSGNRVLLIGRRDFWKNCCNLNDPPSNQELQRFSFVNEDGEKIFQCSLFTDVMKINMGTLFIGQLTLKKQVSLDCSDWDLSTLIVEDRNADQVLRFERNKSHFEVLLYPEQLKICQVSRTWWSPQEFPFLAATPDKRIFGVPLPDEFPLTLRKKALLLTSSIYLYDKYYKKSRKCQVIIGIFVLSSVVLIGALILVERLGLLQSIIDGSSSR